MEQTTQEILIAILMAYGYTKIEALHLLGRFLEEEAELYIECMKYVEEHQETNDIFS